MNVRWFVPIIMLALTGSCARVQLPEATIRSGESQEALDWNRTVQFVLGHHPDLREARATLESRAHARNAALGAYLPTVQGTVGRDRARTTSSSMTDSIGLNLAVSQPLFTGFKTTGQMLQASRQWEAAHFAYEETSAEVRRQLREAFVEVLRSTRLLDVNRRIAERRKENAQLIRLRYEAGREHEGSLLRAQAIAEQAAFDVRQTERRIESQSLELGRQLGGTSWVPMHLAGDLEQMTPDAPEPVVDYAELASQAPTVERLTKTAGGVKAAIISTQAALWPAATTDFNYGYSGSRVSNLEDDSSVGVTVSMPLFRGGRNIEGVLGSNADYQAAVEAARSARDERVALLGKRWSGFRDAWEFIEVRRHFLEAARKRAEIIRAQYTTGLTTFQDFDIAEQELADSEKSYVGSLADVLIQQAEWEAAKGSMLEDVLKASGASQ